MTKPLRIGILGTARITRSVLPHFQQCDAAEITVVGSRQIEKARDFAREFSIPDAVEGYDTVLESTCDAVYVPLPPSLHCEWVCRAAKAGKHVLCEKPLSTSAADARTMIETCRRHNVVLLDSVMWYHSSRGSEMQRLATDGTVGDLRQITSAFTFPGDLLASSNIRFSSELGGGSLLDIGWYCVGASLWMFGDLPERVFAAAEWREDIDWHLNGLMWFSENRVASFECGFNAIRRRWIEITGSNAAIVCDDFTRPWKIESPRYWIHDAEGTSHQHIVPHPPIERCLVDEFCRLVQQQKVVHDWSMLSLQTQHVCDSLRASALNRRVEVLAPLQELAVY